jgi:hypothetical protein
MRPDEDTLEGLLEEGMAAEDTNWCIDTILEPLNEALPGMKFRLPSYSTTELEFIATIIVEEIVKTHQGLMRDDD